MPWPAPPTGRSPSPRASAIWPSKSTACKDEDIFFDPLVLPISTGIEEDRRNAMETIEGTRRISAELPELPHRRRDCRNVSFGLKPAARVVLNSAFLHELTRGGFDRPPSSMPARFSANNRIADEKWNAAMDLIYDRRREGFDPLTHFISLFPEGADVPQAEAVDGQSSRSRRSSRGTSSTARSATLPIISMKRCRNIRRWTSSTTSCSRG